jgi:hypothetical protein
MAIVGLASDGSHIQREKAVQALSLRERPPIPRQNAIMLTNVVHAAQFTRAAAAAAASKNKKDNS